MSVTFSGWSVVQPVLSKRTSVTFKPQGRSVVTPPPIKPKKIVRRCPSVFFFFSGGGGPFLYRKRAEYCFESTVSEKRTHWASLSSAANSVSSAKNSVSSLWHANNRPRGIRWVRSPELSEPQKTRWVRYLKPYSPKPYSARFRFYCKTTICWHCTPPHGQQKLFKWSSSWTTAISSRPGTRPVKSSFAHHKYPVGSLLSQIFFRGAPPQQQKKTGRKWVEIGHPETVHLSGPKRLCWPTLPYIMSYGSQRPNTTKWSIWEYFGLCLLKTCCPPQSKEASERAFTILFVPNAWTWPSQGPKRCTISVAKTPIWQMAPVSGIYSPPPPSHLDRASSLSERGWGECAWTFLHISKGTLWNLSIARPDLWHCERLGDLGFAAAVTTVSTATMIIFLLTTAQQCEWQIAHVQCAPIRCRETHGLGCCPLESENLSRSWLFLWREPVRVRKVHRCS